MMAVPRSRSRRGLEEGKQSGLTRILVWVSVDVELPQWIWKAVLHCCSGRRPACADSGQFAKPRSNCWTRASRVIQSLLRRRTVGTA